MRRLTALKKNRNLLGTFGLMSLLAATTGCETKSFLDPSEVGRYEKTPLLVPILDEVVVGIEQSEILYAGAREVTSEDLVAENIDATVGPNDLIQVVINDLVAPGYQSVEQKRVTQNGKINLPMVGAIHVGGLTEAEVEALVNSEYNAKGLIVDARSSVTVVEALSRTYSMSGYIGAQGVFPLRRSDFRLLDAITSSQGVTSDQGIDYIFIIRKLNNGAAGTPVPQATPQTPVDPGVDPLAPQSKAKKPADFRARVLQPTTEPNDELAPTEPGEVTPLPEDRVI
ncbi:MAG TPA: polysaccharide biosynthesis/export family protein, partial [Tepidisphaeraceae bacterium]|nr:polysaccharide biosynthesis/export family protein [Tepidisphaeraceae bacterium]